MTHTPSRPVGIPTTEAQREARADRGFSVAERYRVTAKEWAEAEAAAGLLEETKSAVLAELSLQAGGTSIAGADRIARASPAWREHLTAMIEARRVANLKKVHLKYLEMIFYTRQGADADRRAELRMVGGS